MLSLARRVSGHHRSGMGRARFCKPKRRARLIKSNLSSNFLNIDVKSTPMNSFRSEKMHGVNDDPPNIAKIAKYKGLCQVEPNGNDILCVLVRKLKNLLHSQVLLE